METFNETFSILMEGIKYALPAVIVLLTVKYMNDSGLKKQKLNQDMLIKDEIMKKHIPLKLAAYERAVLFMERISPQNLLTRVNPGGKSAREFHAGLVQEIRSEYEHNMVQQVYVTTPSWAALVKAKEEMLTIINLSMKEMEEEHNGLDLSRKIIEKFSSLKEMPTQNAIILLRRDIQAYFKL